jgi:hypothetical protein
MSAPVELRRALGPDTVVLCGSRELPDGARGPLLVAESLFRLDVRMDGDTVLTAVRDLGGGALREPRSSGYGLGVKCQGGRRGRHHAHHVAFRAEDATGTVDVSIIVTGRRDPDRSLTRFTAQAVLRRAA